VWCDGVRARERDGETLKECVIVASMAVIAPYKPQYDTNSIGNMAESSIISSMRRIIQIQ
jgi:hypothetical protein